MTAISDHLNMTTTMDIAVCFDSSFSISFYSDQIRRRILSIVRKALSYDDNGIRMALIEFQSHTDDWVTKVHPFTSSISTFQERINAVQTNGGNLNDCKAIAEALSACLTLDWRPNDRTDRYHEKLVILITDGAPCSLLHDECPRTSRDLWKLSGEFEKQDIVLVVVGIEPTIGICDDFYCGLANKTGGEYIPLINAHRVLSFVIETAILEEDTISQVFRHIDIDDIQRDSLYHHKNIEKRARFMMENCRTMSDIRKWLYNYRDQLVIHSMDMMIFIGDNDNISEPYTPPNSCNFSGWYSNPNIFSSTPITDDEGYRTRLPTTASPDSSFTRIDGCYSPVFICPAAMDLHGSSSEIDDDSL